MVMKILLTKLDDMMEKDALEKIIEQELMVIVWIVMNK